MIRVKVPTHLYKTTLTKPLEGPNNVTWVEVVCVLNQDVKDWLETKLGYVPEFVAPAKAFIDLPNEDLVTEFQLVWF